MADFSGSSKRQSMTNPNCQMWVEWDTSRTVNGNKPGWNVHVKLKAVRTPGFATYGRGNTSLVVHDKSESNNDKMIEITGTEKVYQEHTFFIQSESGKDIELAGNATIWVPNVVSGTVTFNAKVKQNLWTITFNANSGSGAPASVKKWWGIVINLPNTKPTREGYNFVNWNTKSDGSGSWYAPGQAFGADSNITLYAIWSKKEYEITFNANGGTILGSDIYIKKVNYGEKLGELPVAVRNNYKLINWLDSSQAIVTQDRVITKNETYIAEWKLNSVIYLKHNDVWRKAIPYVKDNGRWRKATSYVYSNNKWNQGVGK